jgi:hypothetical protein
MLVRTAVSAKFMVRKDLGLFSSSGDQQEQPFMQVIAYRSIWIKQQRVAASSIG